MLNAFEHEFVRHLKKDLELPQGQGFLLAVSGGLDSMAMLELFYRTQAVLKSRLVVMCVHHGSTTDLEMQMYRDSSAHLVRQQAQSLNIDYVQKSIDSVQARLQARFSEKPISSEADFRRMRYLLLQSVREQLQLDWVVTAHHADDLLETQLLRLLRGVGEQGLVAIRPRRGVLLRPLLKTSRRQLEAYVKTRSVSWVEDPSNAQVHYLRNWVRKKWLQPLRQEHPEFLQPLVRSLSNISKTSQLEKKDNVTLEVLLTPLMIEDYDLVDSLRPQEKPSSQVAAANFVTANRVINSAVTSSWALKRDLFSRQDKQTKIRLVQNYIQKCAVQESIIEFRHSQMEEIIKQLDKVNRVHRFQVGLCIWFMNPTKIWCSFFSKK